MEPSIHHNWIGLPTIITRGGTGARLTFSSEPHIRKGATTILNRGALSSDIAAYLSELKGTNLRSLKDLILYNNRFTDVEGGRPGYLPGFQQGQDGFLGSLAT